MVVRLIRELIESSKWSNRVFLGESASPFIDEEDDLTSERGRLFVCQVLFAHAVGYKIIVGAHYIVHVRCM